jgi:hypothetical protein
MKYKQVPFKVIIEITGLVPINEDQLDTLGNREEHLHEVSWRSIMTFGDNLIGHILETKISCHIIPESWIKTDRGNNP